MLNPNHNLLKISKRQHKFERKLHVNILFFRKTNVKEALLKDMIDFTLGYNYNIKLP